ncbi:MAG: hypothetical protein QOH58_2757 [Thermoleophilaceae bacterium]|jgi:hypothetical protein|nr:hypothetical protein [Thermoleophilaceae bacterium]
MAKLVDLVAFLFSKNAGPYLTTFDIVFPDEESYRHVCDSGVFTKEKVAELYKVPVERILSIHNYDAGRIIKFTMTREISSGDFGDRSVFGSQQWAPLIELEVPELVRD